MRSRGTVVLAGNPNVGKSTLFNALTGLHQHTGNWTGKTVERAQGKMRTEEGEYTLVDLPGCYSLTPRSPEEAVAGTYLKETRPEAVVAVCDATALTRSLGLVLEILEITSHTVVCINLTDQARRQGIFIDTAVLENCLGVPVVATAGNQKQGLIGLKEGIERAKDNETALKIHYGEGEPLQVRTQIAARIGEVCRRGKGDKKVAVPDRLLTDKRTALPLIAIMLAVLFWLTVEAASYPSAWLQKALFSLENVAFEVTAEWGWPHLLRDFLWRGVYRVTAWVVSVMLPPMTIFFPLFSLIEDWGLMPRIAFDFDKGFQKCGACGKQSLCMMMGLGCNAVGVVGCRIIPTRRERLMAMLTNVFIPCNGRLPMLITLLTLFVTGSGIWGSLGAAAGLAALLCIGIGATWVSCFVMSKTVLSGQSSPFVLELPPYRRPDVLRTLWTCMTQRVAFVLGRALAVAAPAGAVIWLLGHWRVGDLTLMQYVASLLDTSAAWLGLDGVILLAFILGTPAGEIVLPLILMGYSGGGRLTHQAVSLLVGAGWDLQKTLCVLLFTLMHWPCATTLLTIRKESGSWGWTLLAAVLPTVWGVAACLLLNCVLGFK